MCGMRPVRPAQSNNDRNLWTVPVYANPPSRLTLPPESVAHREIAVDEKFVAVLEIGGVDTGYREREQSTNRDS